MTSNIKPYTIISPLHIRAPILISVPHSGTFIPEKVISTMISDQVEILDDTDFEVDQLYQFAQKLGISLIVANYHRWYIDLNRSLDQKDLYDDGRLTTSLFPTTDFFGRNIYKCEEIRLSKAEQLERIESIYNPYYTKIQELLDIIVREFGSAILWDAHSIRRHVPTIHPEPFKDLILGTNDNISASGKWTEIVKRHLNNSKFSIALNHPFKGGNITRHFGKPDHNIHAFQLEMSKDCYLDYERFFNPNKANAIISLLRHIFIELSESIFKA